MAVETLGPWNKDGLLFVRELGRRMSEVTGDPRECAYLRQRISVAIQVGNSVAIPGALSHVNEASVLRLNC